MAEFLPGVKRTFDDVLLVPGYSDIISREDISLKRNFLGYGLEVPIISSNMDLVTGADMAIAMWEAGGLGILHRFYSSLEEEQRDISKVYNSHLAPPVAISVGIRNLEEIDQKLFWMESSFEENTFIVTIDVAHGHHKKVQDLIVYIKNTYPRVKIIAGNVSTWDGYVFLAEAGADAVKVGIGPGSVCTTRIVTGCGYPQFSSIIDIAKNRPEFGMPDIISDGGIRSSGDIVKALAAGADMVMVGNLLAGTEETPGEIIEAVNGRRYRRYRGQSIFGVNGERYVKEGVSGYVEDKGPVANVIRYLSGGIRSGLSYVGARNLRELKEKAVFVTVSSNTINESNPRIAEVI